MLVSFNFTSASAGDIVLMIDVNPGRSLNALIADALDVAHSVSGDHEISFVTLRLPHQDSGPKPANTGMPVFHHIGIRAL